MSWGEVALWWLPTILVGVMALFGLLALAARPGDMARRYWAAGLLLAGVAATGASGWRQLADRMLLVAAEGRQSARLVAQGAAVKSLEGQLRTLQQKTSQRTIEPAIAAKLADDLRKAGSHRVVVSCAPKDVEAYGYANQIATVLRQAGWEALGPEATTIFGEAPAMGLRLYITSGGAAPPDAAKLLIDTFTRLNIPFESGITPSAAIPDPATTEIFVSHKP